MKISLNLLHNLCNSLLHKYVALMVNLSLITIVQMPSAQLMWTIKTLYLVVALKSRILCYNIFSVGIGTAKATV